MTVAALGLYQSSKVRRWAGWGVFLPGHSLPLMDFGLDLHQGGLVAVELAVALQQIRGGGPWGCFLCLNR